MIFNADTINTEISSYNESYNDFNDNDTHSCDFNQSNEQFIPNTIRMWRAVFAQVVIDMMSNSKKTEYIKLKKQSIQWLTDSKFDADFKMICELASLNKSLVKEKLAPIIKKSNGV